ncbi:AMP-dependent synthetase [Sphingobium sp. TCM1]|nr:AMP-dependent synthetase [Sphingobium sp. TCM1]
MEDPARLRIEATSLGDLLLMAWDKAPDAEALVFPDARLSYDNLVRRAMLRARQLWAAGIRPRDHVGILLPTSVDFVETLFGVAFCGATSVMLNARYKPMEIAYVTNNADLKAIVTTRKAQEHSDFVGRIEKAFPDLAERSGNAGLSIATAPKLRHILLMEDNSPTGFTSISDLNVDAVEEADIHQARICVRVRDPAMILYTSGTSSNPKGCLISHEAITREARMLATRWSYTAQDRVWSPLPLFHVAAMLGMLSVLDRCGTFVGMPHFDPGESLRMIEREKATSLFVPFVTFLQGMMYAPEFASVDLSHVRHINSCFAAQPEKVGRTWREKAPHILHVGTFGMTEAFGVVTTGGEGMDPETGFHTLGYPLPGIEVRIIDAETGNDLGVDAHGEVLIRGFGMFDGYYRDAEKTAAALDADGWYHSGDIGSVDADGHLMYRGRFKDMLKVGGENVAAAEVEAVLAMHPAVKLAQVVGIPDDRLVEIPAAFIEGDPAAATSEELIAFTRDRLSSFKVPRHIRFVDEWPMSASKIQKFKLRQKLMDELGIVAEG